MYYKILDLKKKIENKRMSGQKRQGFELGKVGKSLPLSLQCIWGLALQICKFPLLSNNVSKGVLLLPSQVLAFSHMGLNLSSSSTYSISKTPSWNYFPHLLMCGTFLALVSECCVFFQNYVCCAVRINSYKRNRGKYLVSYNVKSAFSKTKMRVW